MENKNTFQHFYDMDPYMKQGDLQVISCEKMSSPQGGASFHLVCDNTFFYPEGGGQPGDRGKIGQAQVLDTQYGCNKEGDEVIYHLVDRELVPGFSYPAQIDWDRRFHFMQHHSGEHIFSGLAHQFFGVQNVGFHLNENEMTVDFNRSLSGVEIEKLEAAVNQCIYENIPITSRIIPAEESDHWVFRSKLDLHHFIRLVEIPGADTCACCGTHVKHTGEIGSLYVIKQEKNRSGMRFTLLCGEAARDFNKKNLYNLQGLSQILSLPFEQVQAGVNDNLLKYQALQAKVENLCQIVWDQAEIDFSNALILIQSSDFPEIFLKKMIKNLANSGNPCKALLFYPSSDENKMNFLGSQNPPDQPLLDYLKTHYQVRGGGKPAFIQGGLYAPLPDFQKDVLNPIAQDLGSQIYVL